MQRKCKFSRPRGISSEVTLCLPKSSAEPLRHTRGGAEPNLPEDLRYNGVDR